MEAGMKRRGEPVRQRVLDAAERLLRDGKAEFSMRDLASEAGVSFATPFNQFGSKPAIMHALSARRIDAMLTRLSETPQPQHAADREPRGHGLDRDRERGVGRSEIKFHRLMGTRPRRRNRTIFAPPG
jgi:AcrR family transcriptional regulator